MPRNTYKTLLAALAIPLALALTQATQALAGGTHPAGSDAFLPSRSGLSFINPSPAAGAVGLGRVTAGRCGGMAFAALDYHASGKKPPVASKPGVYVQIRNVTSIIDNAPRFVAWSIAPRSGAWWRGGSVGALTRTRELPRLATALAAGPAPLGLTRASGLREISRNHQVVAYALTTTEDKARVRVYDPNLPGADDAVLELDLAHDDAPIIETRGGQVVALWTGAFVEHYARPLLVP